MRHDRDTQTYQNIISIIKKECQINKKNAFTYEYKRKVYKFVIQFF